MKALEQTATFFMKPINQNIEMLRDNDETTAGQSVFARMCFLAQIISSLVALPIILLVGLATAFINLCSGEKVGPAFTMMADKLKLTQLFALPMSLVGVFAPLKTTEEFGNSLNNCLHIN